MVFSRLTGGDVVLQPAIRGHTAICFGVVADVASAASKVARFCVAASISQHLHIKQERC